MTTWLGSQRALWIAIALSIAVAALSLGGGFVTDDYGFRAVLHAGARPAWDLFRFQSGDPEITAAAIRFGHLAWWAAPDLKIHFLRPLTGVLFALDDRLFGDVAIAYRVHSLLWLALLLGGVASLYRRVLTPVAATLGVAAFGLAAAHTEAYAWVSARHVVVGGAGAAWALAIYARGGRVRWLGLVALAVGLAGSEAALGAVPIWCALACAREPSWKRRAIECAPAIALGFAYLALYTALGGGTRASGGYHDPISDPLGFCALAIVRVPILLGDAALAIPAELAFVASHLALAIAGVLAVAIVALAWRTARPVPAVLGWLALGGVLAVLPGVAGYPAGRVLLVPDLAFCAILGALIERSAKPLAIVLAVAHFIAAPLLALHDQRALAHRGRFTERVARDVIDAVPSGSRAIVVAASDPFVFLYPRGVLATIAPGTVTCWSVLSAARSIHRLTRIGDHELVVEPIERPLLDGSFDALFRSPDRPFSVGDSVEQCGANVRVAAIDARGLPTKLEITFQRKLDDPKLAFLAWRDHHLARLALPAVGEMIELPAFSP